MKYSNLKYVVFVIASVFLIGCNGDDNQSDIAFVKFFGDGTNDHGVDLCMHNDVIYVLANAKANDENQKISPYLYFLNKQGEFVEEPLVLDDLEEDEEAQKLLIDSESNLYIVSNVKNASGNEKIHIRKIQNNISTSLGYFGDNLSDVISVTARDAIISESEEEIVIVGSERSSTNLNAYFLRVSLDGDEIFQNNYGDRIEDDEAFRIIKVEDNYYFTGYSEGYNSSSTNRERSIWIVQLNSSGRNTGNKSYGELKINEGLSLTKSGNSFLLASSERNSNDDISGLKVYKIDINSLNIEQTIDFNETHNLEPSDIVLTNNGFIVTANKYPRSKNYGNICALNYDIEGNYISKKEFGPTGKNATILQSSRAIMIDNGLLIVGYNENELDEISNSDIALLKLKSSNDIIE